MVRLDCTSHHLDSRDTSFCAWALRARLCNDLGAQNFAKDCSWSKVSQRGCDRRWRQVTRHRKQWRVGFGIRVLLLSVSVTQGRVQRRRRGLGAQVEAAFVDEKQRSGQGWHTRPRVRGRRQGHQHGMWHCHERALDEGGESHKARGSALGFRYPWSGVASPQRLGLTRRGSICRRKAKERAGDGTQDLT